MTIKAAAGQWVIDRRAGSSSSVYRPAYYAECDAEAKNSENWASGLVPQTDACYRTALDFTSLSAYQFDIRFAAVRPFSKQFSVLL